MFRKLPALLMVLSASFAESFELPEYIDFSRFTSGQGNADYEPISWNMGYYAFNFAPEVSPLFDLLKRQYHLDVAVETGTYEGNTTVFFSYLFDEVHTIEIREDLFAKSKQHLRECLNVQCHLGASPKILSDILPSLKTKRLLFYLDAHGWGESPIFQELEEIAKTHRDNCILVIDDIEVPNRSDIAYDAGLSIDNLRLHLANTFDQYTIHYLIPKLVRNRAKLIVIPKQWRSQASSTKDTK